MQTLKYQLTVDPDVSPIERNHTFTKRHLYGIYDTAPPIAPSGKRLRFI